MINPADVVTLSNREREATVLRAISGGGDGFAPRTHRRAQRAVRFR